MSFIPLHIETGYTFLKSSILIANLIKEAKNDGYSTLGICDRYVMYGFPKFNQECLKNNIKPIFGLDAKIDDFLDISLFIKNEEGYKNLCYISTILQKDNTISSEEIKDLTKGLIAVVPTNKNEIFNSIDDKLFAHNLNKYTSLFDQFLIGIEIYNKEMIPHVDLIRSFAQQYAYETIAFPLVRYLKKDDAISIKLLEAIKNQTSISIEEPIDNSDYFFKTKDEITKFYSLHELDNCKNIFKDLDFTFLKKRGELLHFDPSKDASILLKEKIFEGLKIRNIELKDNEEYRSRLNYEYLTIEKMGYCDYFLIVQDYVKYARNNDILVGPGRGSAAGSLVSYLLGITEVDPLKFNLLFERFLNPQRKTMPDIDIDFQDTRRDEVFNYLINKYGIERCSRVIAFQTFGAKQSLRDITKAIGYPNAKADEIAKTIPNNYNANNYTLDYAYANIPTFKEKIDENIDNQRIFKLAHSIEGLPRQKGLHAAGLILDNNDLRRSIPLTYENGIDLVTQYEKDYLEDQGFLKMDLLGLTHLTTIANCLKIIKAKKNIDLNYLDIPYNDKKIFDLIKEKRTMGIFQLDTSAAGNALSYIKPSCFNDIVATISLDRPGPMAQIPAFALRKEGKAKITYLSPSLEPILKDTYGIIVYQEQIMQIARVYAGFSFAKADLFRRAISKKHQSELIQMRDDFTKGALKNNHNIKEINSLFDLILKFASYGFNKSHAVCYAMIACQEAYLKTYYGCEFYMAILDQEYGSNDVKFAKYISEIRKNNIEILLPNINYSTTNFELVDNKLLMPLTGINNFPRLVILNILNERNKNGLFKDFLDFVVRMYQSSDPITENQIQKLIDAGVFDTLYPNRKSLKQSVPYAIQYASTSVLSTNNLFENFGISFKYVDTEDDLIERIKNEKEALGVMISDSFLNHIDKNLFTKYQITKISDLLENKETTILCAISHIKTTKIKKGKDAGKPMAFVSAYDETGEIELIVFSDVYAIYANKLVENNIVIVTGRLQKKYNNNDYNFVVKDINYEEKI